VLILAVFSGGDALAVHTGSTPAPPSPQHIVLWSSQGPVAVDRPPAAGVAGAPDRPDPEGLLRQLLEGPTAEEQAQGLSSAIPGGTRLAAYLDPLEGTAIVRLRVPQQALEALTHEAFEIIVQQIGKTLLPIDWHDLRIQVQDPAAGDFVPMADFLPRITVPAKPSTSSGASAGAPPLVAGSPPAPGQAQPVGALTGKTVYVSAGHGWEWNDYVYNWRTQRPPYPSPGYSGPIVEDHNNAEAVDQYLLHYLWNAGAQVWPVRERDMNPAEAIVDDGDAGYSAPGWMGAADGYAGDCDQIGSVTGLATHTASWEAVLPSDGQYAVYVWYEAGQDRPWDAQYTVNHAGGQTTVHVDQRHHGYTWHHIGTYGFLSGDPARVSLSNQSSSAGRTVVADAVRFGGGTFDSLSGIDTAAPWAPGRPWWEVAAYYYTQKMGMAAGYGDVTVRPVYARWEHAGTDDDAVYVSWHSNGATGYAQWDYSGTESYVHNGDGLPRTSGSLDLQDAVHDEVVHDIRAGWDAGWIDRGQRQANLGELRLLWDEDNPANNLPGTLLEIGFHDHPGDTDTLKEPRFNQLVARAVYQGVVKYWNPSAPLLPEPPTALSVVNVGGGQVRVSWAPSPTDGLGLAGHAATGYRVYTSPNGVGWSNGIPVASGTEYTIGGLPPGQLLFVRVSGTNAGGESFPTETLAVRVGDAAETLIVNGFDRLNRSMLLLDDETIEGANMRMILNWMNSFDYAVQHGESIPAPLAFDSATNGAVRSGRVNLNNYTIVDWILGEESTTDQTLDPTERALVRAFLQGDGALFMSGSEIGYHLDYAGADPNFYNTVLHADFAGDDAGTYQVTGVTGSAFDGLSFSFAAPGMYDAESPDLLHAYGAQEALKYQGVSLGAAAVQYASGCERVVTFGFPFETIWPPSQRTAVMGAVFGFLDECLNPTVTVETSIASPAYGSAHNSLPDFSGSAYAQPALLSHVEVQVQSSASGDYWNGSGWVASATWLYATGAETWSYPLPASMPQGAYHLRARGRATDGSKDDTPAETVFTYDTVAPAPTSLITPTGGVTVTALPNLVLEWATVAPDGGSDISYRVEFDGQAWSAAGSSYTVTQAADGPHTWRVRVQDEAGNASPWTDWGIFVVSRFHTWLPLVSRGQGGVGPCSDLVVNGGFETDAGWLFNPESGYETYVTDRFHSGQRSALVGHDAAPYSSVRQQITLPEGSGATLRLWFYPISENNDPDDLHYVWLRDQGSHPLELATSDAREWRQGEYDLTPFMGQTVTIYVGAVNDGDGDTASLYVDDVELLFCP
jgi:hypothetical protein